MEKGKWLHENFSRCSSRWICSECGEIAYYPFHGSKKQWAIKPCSYKFCPNCGIEMSVENK